ncbi:MAG: redoxin domain-containing protein [Candidatus Aenigmarchaeota archaeon]|nr:redoxin domain-containing protein [Candidatus Aenigmarchaeota archaeon]
MPEVGHAAPDFALLDSDKKEVKLSARPGHNVILAFYPCAWSPTCTDEMACFRDDLDTLSKHAEVLAISADSTWSHKAWKEQLGISFPLLSDPARDVIKRYGVLAADGASERAYFIVDRDGVVRFKHVMPERGKKLDNSVLLKELQKL